MQQQKNPLKHFSIFQICSGTFFRKCQNIKKIKEKWRRKISQQTIDREYETGGQSRRTRLDKSPAPTETQINLNENLTFLTIHPLSVLHKNIALEHCQHEAPVRNREFYLYVRKMQKL